MTRVNKVVQIVAAVVITLTMLGSVGDVLAKDDIITLRFSTHMSQAHKQVANAMVPYAKMIKEESKGRLDVKIFSGGVLHGPRDGFKACASNITDFTQAYPGYVPGKFNMFFALHLPFLFPNAFVATLVAEELYPKYLKSEYEAMGVYLMAAPSTATYQILTKDKPVKAIEDIKGLKLRSPGGITNDIVQTLGAVPVSVPAAETYTALQTGLVDGTFMNDIDIIANRLYEVCKYRTKLDVSVYSVANAMNKKTFNALPQDLKTIVYNCNRKYGQIMAGTYEMDMEKIIKDIEKKYNFVSIELTQKEKQRFENAAKQFEEGFVKEKEAKGLPIKDFLREIRTLTKKYEKWSPEQIYEYVSKNPVQGIN